MRLRVCGEVIITVDSEIDTGYFLGLFIRGGGAWKTILSMKPIVITLDSVKHREGLEVLRIASIAVKSCTRKTDGGGRGTQTFLNSLSRKGRLVKTALRSFHFQGQFFV